MKSRNSLQIATALDQFNLVAFRRVDESDLAAARAFMGTVRKGITFGCRLAREFIQIVHFEGKMGEIRTDYDRSALVEFVNFNFLLALWRFEKNQLRPAPGRVAANFLQPKNVFIKRDRFLQVLHPIPGV